MHGCCCVGEGRTRPLARRLSGAAASVLPGAVLVLLPKCPLCLAAWLTVVSGMSVSAVAGTWMWRLTILLCVVALALSAVQLLRRTRVRGTIRGWRNASAVRNG